MYHKQIPSILLHMSIELIGHMTTILTSIYIFSYSMTSIVLVVLIQLDTLSHINFIFNSRKKKHLAFLTSFENRLKHFYNL